LFDYRKTVRGVVITSVSEKWYDNLVSIKSLTVIDKSIIIDYSQQNLLSILSNSDIINQFLSIIDIID